MHLLKTIVRAGSAVSLVLLIGGIAFHAIGQTNTFPSSGNAGVGTTSPADKLVVVGSTNTTGFEFGNAAPGGEATALIQIYDRSSSLFRRLQTNALSHVWNVNGSSMGMVLDSSGRLGIGTTNPGQTLDVRSAGSTRIQAMAGAANGYGLLTTTTDESYSSYSEFGSFGSSYSGTLFGQAVANWSFLYSAGASSNGLAIGTNNSKPLILGTVNAERLRIDSSGNVGIGTTSPIHPLHVASSFAGDWVAKFENASATGRGIVVAGGDGASSTALAMQVRDKDHNNRVTFLANGNVGIGTTAPVAKFHVHDGTDGNLWVRNAGTPAWIEIASANDAAGTFKPLQFTAEKFNFSNGNVGIGTTSPGAKLDVNGVIRNSAANGFSIGLDQGQLRLQTSGTTFQFLTPTSEAAPAKVGGLAITSSYSNNSPAYGLYVEGKVGIGLADPGNYKLNVNGEINATGLSINGTPISTGGSSQWTNGTGSISYTGGNVGIGISNPADPLHVSNVVRISPFSPNSAGSYLNAGAALRLINGNIYQQGGNEISSIQFGGMYNSGGVQTDAVYNYIDWSNGSLRIRNNQQTKIQVGGGDEWSSQDIYFNPSGGKVGIGTTSPQQRLSVNYNTSNALPGISVSETSSAASAGVTVNNTDTSGNSAILFNVGDANKGRIKVDNNGLMTLSGSGFGDNLTINSSGNVGIGRTDPSYKLDVYGPSGNYPGRVASPDGYLLFGPGNTGWSHFLTDRSRFYFNTGVTVDTGIVSSYSQDLNLQTSGTTRLTINNSTGNVGVAKAPDATYKLDVNGEINATGLRINGTSISTGGSSQWTGTDSISYTAGNVGIGTTIPGTVLHVKKDGAQLSSGSGANFYHSFAVQNTAGTKGLVLGYDNSSVLGLIGSTNANSGLAFYTNSGSTDAERLRITNTGKVGIGITDPSAKLDVSAVDVYPLIIRNSDASSGYGASVELINSGTGGRSFTIGSSSNQNGAVSGGKFFLKDETANAYRLLIDSSGNVGIGTTSAADGYKLDVNGKTNVTGNLNIAAGNGEPGNIVAAGTIFAKYQDVAEWVPSSEQLAAGTVVVLDTTKSNQVTSSNRSYDTRVAGVISAQPGIALGEKGDSKVLVATTGRVKVKVDASKGPIQIGDLLVTSDVLGVAMKSQEIDLGGVKIHRPGTLIGKALEPLTTGKGEILVLLSLQ